MNELVTTLIDVGVIMSLLGGIFLYAKLRADARDKET